jgi:short-subunit dehydrogenase
MKKIILISGGSDGIGKATAKALSKDHYVVILSPHKTTLVRTAKEFPCETIVCDICSFAACKWAVDRVIKKYGRIDWLVNNAGVYMAGPLEGESAKTIEETIRVNTIGTMFLTRAALPHMKKKKSGSILTVISQAGLYHKPERSVYAASKWALTGFVRCLRDEVRDRGIKVMAIFPGKVKTNLFDKAHIKKDLSRAVEPEDVAHSIVFMLSQKGSTVVPELSITHIQD